MIKGTGTYFTGPVPDTQGLSVIIGNYCGIANGINFFNTANHPSARKRDLVMNYPPEKLGGEYDSVTKVDFTIGSDVWIGKNVILMAGCEIGDGAIIGAHSVVRGKIPAYAVAFGNPTKVSRYRFSPEIIKRLLKIKWWDWPEETIRDRLNDFYDINKFVEKYD